jgi:carboxymethylenebutenolidase
MLALAGCSTVRGWFHKDEAVAAEETGQQEAPQSGIVTAADAQAEVAASAVTEPESGIVEIITDYGTYLDGYVAGPVGAPRAVILLHDRWGFDQQMIEWVGRFGEQGYRALAIDLYDGRASSKAEFANEMMRSVDPEWSDANIRAAIKYLARPQRRIGVVGWGFGGGQSLRAAILEPERVAAVVDIYGPVVTDPDELRKISSPVMGIFAQQDDWVPPDQVERFESAMRNLKNAVAIVNVDADYGFAHPERPAYNESAAQRAWQNTEDFLAEMLN